MSVKKIPLNGKTLSLFFPIETFEFIPILSVLVDELNQLYLCLCSEMRGKIRWIISLTNIEVLRKLLDCDITVNNALIGIQNELNIVEYRDSLFHHSVSTMEEINPDYIANQDTYAEYQDDDVEENFLIAKNVFEDKIDYYIKELTEITNQAAPVQPDIIQNDSSEFYFESTISLEKTYGTTLMESTNSPHRNTPDNKSICDDTLAFAA